MKKISRRDFLKTAALGTAGAAGLGLMGAASGEEKLPFEKSMAWDAEYDVVVAGYGAAGAVAAINAAEHGAKVLIVEKAPRPYSGGNSRFGQNFMAYTDRDMAIQYYKNLRGPYTEIQGDDVIETLVDGFMQLHDWLIDHGLTEDNLDYAARPEWPELYPDPDWAGFRKLTMRPDRRFSAGVTNANLYYFGKFIEERRDSIDVWYASPARSLIQDPETKAIHGVMVEHEGDEYAVRAKNGVILATGGFENNLEMIQNFTAYSYMAPKGCNFNTGDGVMMAQQVGAQLWHMSNCAAPDPNFIDPRTGCGPYFSIASYSLYGTMGATSAIFIGGDGTRFMNEACMETFNTRHGQTYFHGSWVHMPFPQLSYLLFDEQARASGHKPYNNWSEGLETELAAGWIIKGETLEELGEKIGIAGENIAATIAHYNGLCETGVDDDWGREAQYLVPFSGEGPFYALRIVPTVTNTDGGAKRNAQCQVVDTMENPIPHLYSAGSFGSFYVGAYNGGGNMGENFATGMMAGQNAAAVKEDAVQDSLLSREPVNFAYDYQLPQVELGEGQYAGYSWGMNRELAVRLTVKDGLMTALEVVYDNETPGIRELAIEEIPRRILEAQSNVVDTVATATKTSAGIIRAAEDAMLKAGLSLDSSDKKVETVK